MRMCVRAVYKAVLYFLFLYHFWLAPCTGRLCLLCMPSFLIIIIIVVSLFCYNLYEAPERHGQKAEIVSFSQDFKHPVQNWRAPSIVV